MFWGIHDSIDNCWMGSEDGPLTYKEEKLAKMAATILNERCGTCCRYLSKPFPKTSLQFKDRITPILSAEEAINNLEKRIL